MRRLLTRLLLSIAFVAVPTPALAQGRPTTETVITTHFTKSITLADTPPCVGTVTYDVRDIFHITSFNDEAMHVTDVQTGDVTFESAADGKRYTGRFNGTFNLQASQSNGAFTAGGIYQLRVRAEDGTKLHFWITSRVTFVLPKDEPTVELSNVRCTVS